MNSFKSIFLCLFALCIPTACDSGEESDCVCNGDVCDCPVGYGLEEVEFFVTYKLNEEAEEKGMEVQGFYQLLYENTGTEPVSCKTKLQDTEKKLQCSLGMVPVNSYVFFMIMVPEGEGLQSACQGFTRDTCSGELMVEIFRDGGKSEMLEDILVVNGEFDKNVAYRVRVEE